MRFFLEITYKGTAYHGWQIQKNAVSVQEVLNKTLSKVLGEKVETIGSGRTDTGVHALQQFVHLDSEKDLGEETYLYKFNRMLPLDISIQAIHTVTDEANARFDAISRNYEYRINSVKDPFLQDLCYFYFKEVDVEKMNLAADILLKKHNFESFSKVKTEVNHFLCNITRAEWVRKNEKLTFFVSADRFLRGMVRTLVGTLLNVGLHRISVNDFEEIIESKDRKKAGRAAPAQGLFYTKVIFPDHIFLNKK
ncbi:tRNA pseudouridine(38-40) synthase TruA [soil metagenome]